MIVSQTYTSYQGTGVNSGVKQHFVRLAGCSVPCPLRKNCDQPNALKHAGTPISIDRIVELAVNSVGSGGWLHITGGEPLEHRVEELVSAATSSNLRVQIQTSGSVLRDFGSDNPFVTVSPKQKRRSLVEPSEIVLVAADWMTKDFAMESTSGYDCPVYVIPEATDGEFNPESALRLTEELGEAGRDVRLGLQSHLLWGLA